MTHLLRKLSLPAAVATALVLTSCGSSPATPAANAPTAGAGPTATGPTSPVGPPASGQSNGSDVQFAVDMTTNHLQADAMADLAAKNAKDPKIKALALKVKTPQRPEVTAMAGWLVGGGLPIPDATGGHYNAPGMANMPGMGEKIPILITPQEIAALGKTTGTPFDRTWLQLMIKHHEGAALTAQAELTKGLNADAKKLAQAIIDRQSAQVVTMKSMLDGLS